MLTSKKISFLICQHPVDSIPSCLNQHSHRFSGTSTYQKVSYQTMSQKSEEESVINFQQQQKLAVYQAALTKGGSIIPKTLLATNRYVCEVCHKGFQRDQNLQLHRRCHNLPWKLKQTNSTEAKKKVYICPEVACPHHDASRALGDLFKHIFSSAEKNK